MPKQKRAATPATAANVGYEAELWQMADTLRGSMDAAEYKHVVLGLIFLKYISDAFEEQHAKLEAEKGQGADPEDPDEYRALNIFWVPPEARWSHLKAQAKQPTIGQLVDDAMAGIERDNPSLKGVLPKDYARPALDKQRLGQLIDMVSNIKVGDAESRSKDVIGRVYEYFLSQFASAEGKKGGEFYTPRCVVKLLVEMLEPYTGRVYDPCCGSSGMFVQSIEFIRAHRSANGNGGKAKGDLPSPRLRQARISIYGQESNYTTWRLARMNLAIRGIDGQIAHGDTFHNDRHADLRADYILANPPFNVSDWRGELLRDDKRWQYGAPPASNANFAWVQHIIHHLAPAGLAGFVLANGSMSSGQSGEGEIRKAIIEADLVDCMVALPGQLFYSTQIPACLWFLARGKKNGRFRNRGGELLFIDARKLGQLVDRTHRELTGDEIARIARTYHAWRGEKDAGAYADVPGFCKSAALEEIRKHGHVLTPGRYVGAEALVDDGEPFEEKMKRLSATLREQMAEGRKLDTAIEASLKDLGMASEQNRARDTQTGGREATTGVIPGRYSLSVGLPEKTPPSGWRWMSLSAIARLESGHTPSRSVPAYWDGNIPWIGIRDATENHGRTISRTNEAVTQAGIDNSSARVLPPGTVCLSRTASVGYVVVMGRPMATSQDFVNWVCSGLIDSRFLKYVLLSEHESMLRFASGTTHQTIYYPEVKAFHICLPEITEQRAIAHILGTLDDKIELNRRMNETLEAMARALFQSWFVDFDPVRPTGGRFQSTELGEVPDGWVLRPIRDIVEAVFDGPHATPPEADNGAVYLGIKNFTGTHLDLSDIRHISDDDWLKWTRRVTPRGGDIVFTYEATLGFFALIPPWLRCCLGRRTALLRPRPSAANRHYLFHYLIALPFQEFLLARTHPGSTVDRILLTDFPDYPVLLPPAELVQRFEECVEPIWGKIHSNSNQSRTLAALRDALLPNLISGELRVKDAPRFVDGVGALDEVDSGGA